MNPGTNPRARLMVPLALGGFLIAIVIVVAASLGGSGSPSGPSGVAPPPKTVSTTGSSTTGAGEGSASPERTGRKTYVVKPGDNFVRIAEKTGIAVETLQELNPDLDPQALVSGQRIKLTE